MSEPRSTPKELAAFASELRAAIRHRVAGGQTTLAIVVVAGAVVGASLLGRLGTHAARIGGFAIIAGVGALLLGVGLWARSRWRDARRAVVREVGRSNPALGAAIDRAVGLASRTAAVDGEPLPLATPDEVTIELAALHLERQLDKVKIEEVVARAEKRGVGAAWLSFAGMVAVFAAIAVDPARVLEGADVLVARGGRAPFELLLLDDLDVVATPPSYLAQHEIPLRQFTQTSQPRGTVLTVRGRPLHRGRKLVLTDGHEEIAFNDDGKGAVVARWTVVGSTRLRLAARFGDTLVYQHDALAVESIPDAPPAVKLAAAPRTVRLVDVNTVSLAYEASDDHGLLEIALVIRVGDREDRRTLSRPSGSRLERGAHELSTRDPVFRDQFVPIEVTVEAKDNDTVTGPKWGRSASVIVMPPLVGEPEAARYVELTKVRDALVDLLAPRVEAGELEDDQAASRVDAEKTAHKATVAQVERALERTFGGLKITGRTKRLVNGQMRRLELAESTFETEPTGKHFSELVATTEQVVLAVDAAARALGMTDAKDVAKRLASVADEAASASAVATLPDENARGKQRLTAALEVLTGGGRELAKLDELGADLGDVTRGGVGRIQRLADQSNYVEARVAAENLAQRLRLAIASMAGGGGGGGVESGVGDGEGTVDGGGDASEADDAIEKSSNELEDLVSKHQRTLEDLQKALDNATTPEEKKALEELAKDQAKKLREAVKHLPQQGLDGSAAEKAAEGRKQAESAAGALERKDLKGALDGLKSALDSLNEAKKRGQEKNFGSDEAVGEDASDAASKLEDSKRALEDAMDKLEQARRERGGKNFDDAADSESKAAERADDLKKRGQDGDAALPKAMLDRLERAKQAMRDAERLLRERKFDEAREKQEEAQRLLEMARDDDAPPPNDPREDGDGTVQSGPTAVPGEDAHKNPDEFRRRVLEGLAKPGEARLHDAIKRYAEGLLK